MALRVVHLPTDVLRYCFLFLEFSEQCAVSSVDRCFRAVCVWARARNDPFRLPISSQLRNRFTETEFCVAYLEAVQRYCGRLRTLNYGAARSISADACVANALVSHSWPYLTTLMLHSCTYTWSVGMWRHTVGAALGTYGHLMTLTMDASRTLVGDFIEAAIPLPSLTSCDVCASTSTGSQCSRFGCIV